MASRADGMIATELGSMRFMNSASCGLNIGASPRCIFNCDLSAGIVPEGSSTAETHLHGITLEESANYLECGGNPDASGDTALDWASKHPSQVNASHPHLKLKSGRE